MRFRDILRETVWLLLTEKQVSYRGLKREFGLDDAYLEDLRYELIQVRGIAEDQNGEFLLWAGAKETTTPSKPIQALPPVKGSNSATQAKTSVPTRASADVVPLPVKVPPSDAERRQITVMFCDLVGSTALSTQLDPEDLRELILAYQKTCAGVIERYDGFIARYMGDGLLVYFGYPHASEFDAERALHTSLAIVDAMRDLNTDKNLTQGAELAVRIGLATGVVVVGDLIGEGSAEERNVVGETPNLAARLQGLAQPNGIVIGSVTKDLAGDGFLYEDLGAHQLKGITGQVKAWGVIGERELDEAELDLRDSQPLVGRQEELGLLQRAWAQSRAGAGQVVLISGEAGTGKTRLVEALGAEAKAAGFIRMTLRCSPYHTNSALYPVIEHLQRLLGWQREDDPTAKLAKLDQALSGYAFPSDETIPLFAALFSLTLPEGYRTLQMTPQQQRSRTLDEIVAWLFEEAERRPVLQVWEDIHWADPTTLELIGSEIEQCPTVALMTAMTYRPEFSPPWPSRSHITSLTLNPLERVDVEQLITHHAGGKALPAEVVQHIADKADGVPMYVEELTKTIIESGFLRERATRFELTGPLSEVSIPSTLQESLTARLDRLPSGREVAQLGAVLGREFAYDMIRALSALEEPELHKGLNQLVEAELFYQRGRPPRARYMFKQALIQDAAYQLLLKRTRQQYHQQVAELLQAQFPDAVEAHPEVVARHYTAAGAHDQAAHWWQTAGQHAARHFAHAEAVVHFNAGLEALAAGAEKDRKAGREIELLLELVASLRILGRYQDALVALDRAEALAARDRPGDLANIYYLRGNIYFPLGDVDSCRKAHNTAFKFAEKAGSAEYQARALSGLADSYYLRGQMVTAFTHYDRCIEVCRANDYRELEAANLPMRGWGRYYQNDPRGGLEDCLAGVERAARRT